MTSLPYYTHGPGHPPRMRYWAAYKFVWTSPAGWKNLLLASVCVLIPMVGILVLMGYLRDVFLARLDTLDDDRVGYPDFDFSHFVEYLTRGIWPFLVTMVATLVAMPAFFVVAAPLILIPALDLRGAAVVAVVAADVLLGLGAGLLLNVLMVPLLLRAAILEEFAPAFSWTWIKDFARRTWRETLLATVFVFVTSMPLMLVGYAMCFVGMYAAIALSVFAQWHLHFQVYRIYLSRGGTPVPPKPVPPRPVGGFTVGGVPVPAVPVLPIPPAPDERGPIGAPPPLPPQR